MADHRWDTGPPPNRLLPSWFSAASPSGREAAPRNNDPTDDPYADDPDGHNPTQDSPAGDGPDPGGRMAGTPRRWLPSFRAAVLAVALLLGSAGAVALFRGGNQAEVASVNLPAKGSEAAAGGDGAGNPEPGSPGSDSTGSGSGGPEQESSGTEAASSPAVLVIHVAGAVSRPGVVRVPQGSRAGDAVDAAGGPAGDADLAGVNLAAALQDGMMVVVPRMGESPPLPAAGGSQLQSAGTGTGAGAGSGAGPGGLINLNTASALELDALPRVGPVIAERIVQWRTDHGKFTRPEDLDAVPGIGEGMLAALLPLVTV